MASRVGSDPITKESIGLGNVDNTADVDKPISAEQQTALSRVDPGTTGAAGEYMTLGIGGVPAWMGEATVNVLHPRFSVPASGDTTAALQAIITANPGQTIVFPPHTYDFTTLNIPDADTHIVLMAGAVLNKTTSFTDGIVVTGANVTISGPGRIQCPAAWNAVNTAWTYAVVHVKGDGFTADGVRFINVPKVCIGIRDVNDAQVLGCRINGNIPQSYYTGTETGHFAICYDPPATEPNGNVVVTGNLIRSCVQGFIEGNFGTGTVSLGITISGNTFERCRDHGIYLSNALGTLISGNNFSRCRVPVAATGDFHVVDGNTMYTDTTDALHDVTGISLRNANGCVVSHNTIKGVSLASGTVISITRLTTSGPINNNIVEGNTIICSGGAGRGISVGPSSLATEMSGNIIRGNIVKVPVVANFGIISLTASATVRGTHNEVSGNTITYINATNSYGIHLNYQDHAIVRENLIKWEVDAASATVIDGVRMVDSIDCVIESNRQVVTPAWGTNITIRGHHESGTSDYNYVANNVYLYDLTKLTGATPLLMLGANSIRDNNRTARAWPSHETGAGAPSAARPNGSTYRRTDGVSTTDNLYIRRSGAWVGIA